MRAPSSNRKSSSLCHCMANQGSCWQNFLDLKPHSFKLQPDNCSTLTPIFNISVTLRRRSQEVNDCSVTGWLHLLFIRMNEASEWRNARLEPHDTRNYKNKILNNLFTHTHPPPVRRGHRFTPPTHSPSPLFTTIQRPLCHSARSCFLSSVRWRRQPPAELLRKSPPSRNRSSLHGETRRQSPRWWRQGEGGPEEEQTGQGEGSDGHTTTEDAPCTHLAAPDLQTDALSFLQDLLDVQLHGELVDVLKHTGR